MDVFYFGCWDASCSRGHCLYDSSGWPVSKRSAVRPPDSLMAAPIDGVYPRRPEFRRRFEPRAPLDMEPEDQSAARLSLVDDWTILAFWDYTAGTRPGSNSAFLAPGERPFDEMIALAREHFPTIVERIEAVKPIYLRGDE